MKLVYNFLITNVTNNIYNTLIIKQIQYINDKTEDMKSINLGLNDRRIVLIVFLLLKIFSSFSFKIWVYRPVISFPNWATTLSRKVAKLPVNKTVSYLFPSGNFVLLFSNNFMLLRLPQTLYNYIYNC